MNTHPMDYAAIEAEPGLVGNVYFLAPVNFENAAFCKIGRAKNDPEARWNQINKSSTGNVLWGVRHVVTVDDHIRFERLVHELLASCRNQGAGQRREISIPGRRRLRSRRRDAGAADRHQGNPSRSSPRRS